MKNNQTDMMMSVKTSLTVKNYFSFFGQNRVTQNRPWILLRDIQLDMNTPISSCLLVRVP